jgi:hypothetical protein
MKKARPHDQATLLARVWKARKSAVPIWAALSLLAEQKGRKLFAVRRRTLAKLSGIERIATISEAITTLERLGIVRRRVRRCRRPDGTLFHRLRIRLVHQITENATIHQVRKTRYAPGTAPGSEKCNHSPGTPDSEKCYPSPIGDVGACGVHTPPQRTHAASASAAGARRSAEASRRTPAGAACQSGLDSLSPAARAALDQLSAQIGCPVSAFEILQNGVAFLEAAGVFITVNPDGSISFDADEEAGPQPWEGSEAQIQLVKRAIALAKEARPFFWSQVITHGQVDMAREVALRVGCRLADFEPLGKSLVLGDGRPFSRNGEVRIDPDKIRLCRVIDGRRTEEPWRATADQIKIVRQALAERFAGTVYAVNFTTS